MSFPRTLWSSEKSDWGTPLELYHALDSHFRFTLDPCTTPDNPLGTPKYYTVEDDGLARSWAGERVFVNPPYSRRRDEPAAWVRKAYLEALNGGAVCVLLLAARTDTAWFHDYCSHGLIGFIRGRLRFRGARSSAPFPSMIVVFGEGYWRLER
ncbi:MAG: DNA N-6-adenine-methyltransferase [Candidatus Bathyarchaeota archaeon]